VVHVQALEGGFLVEDCPTSMALQQGDEVKRMLLRVWTHLVFELSRQHVLPLAAGVVRCSLEVSERYQIAVGSCC